jgi:hypothetical protein
LLPENDVFVLTGCAFHAEAGIYQTIDWRAIDFLDLGGGQLPADGCAGKSGVQDYVAFIRSMTAYVRGKNPKIIVEAHLSFGSISPASMIEAVREVGSTVDGFLLAYPIAPNHQHRYSSAQNLEAVLQSVRSR